VNTKFAKFFFVIFLLSTYVRNAVLGKCHFSILLSIAEIERGRYVSSKKNAAHVKINFSIAMREKYRITESKILQLAHRMFHLNR
jgi:hypothetical protein